MVIRRDGSPSMFPGALLFAPYVSLLRAVSMHLSLSSVCFSPLSHFSSSSCRSSFSLFLTLYSLIFSLSQLFLYIYPRHLMMSSWRIQPSSPQVHLDALKSACSSSSPKVGFYFESFFNYGSFWGNMSTYSIPRLKKIIYLSRKIEKEMEIFTIFQALIPIISPALFAYSFRSRCHCQSPFQLCDCIGVRATTRWTAGRCSDLGWRWWHWGLFWPCGCASMMCTGWYMLDSRSLFSLRGLSENVLVFFPCPH